MFAAIPRIKEAAESVAKKDPESEKALKEAAPILKDFLAINTDGAEYFVMDLSGKIILSTDEKQVGMDKSGDEYFLKGQKEIHIKDVYQSPTTGQVGFVISGPVYARSSKELVGVCGIRYSLTLLNAMMTDRQGMGETGETYIVNKEGYFLTDSRFINDVTLKKKIETEPVKLWQSERKEMEALYPDYRGQTVLGVSMGEDLAKSDSGLDWLILTEIDVKEVFAPIQKLGFLILILGLVISVMAALIGYLIAKGISKPIAAIAERLSASSQQLSATAQEMNATTEEVSSTVQQIAKGSEITAQKVEETSKVMEQMNASVSQVATGAQSAASTALQASQTAQKGGDAAKDAINKMTQIAAVVVTSADTIKKLSERSEQISEITDVITGIADQTNLLALNAAIEAARAGEQGRGFAVVAEEVRKLAEGSAKAADQIGKLVKDVQKETAQAVLGIEGLVKETGAVKDIAQRVAEDLDKIIKNAEGVASQAEQVSAATEQMSAGTKQVVKSVDEIAATAEEAASSTEEASASTQEMTASMEEMAASAQELSEMAIGLRDLVGKFKVGDDKDRQSSFVHRTSLMDDSQKKTEAASRAAKLREKAQEVHKKVELKNQEKK